MKKTIFSLGLFLITFVLKAQNNDKDLAMQLVTKSSSAIGLNADDLKNVIVSSTYYNTFANTRMVYLQQSYQGLPVFNEMQVLAFRGEKLVSAAGERIAGIGKKSGMITAAPSLLPEQAVLTALASKKLSYTGKLTAVATNTTKMDFGKMGIALENVTAELMWLPLQDGREVKLVWQVFLVPKNSSDYLLISVDAHSNKIIQVNNLTVYCKFDESELADSKPAIEIKIQDAPQHLGAQQSPNIVSTANYLVVPWPAESPIHPGGTPALRTNP